MVSTTPPLSANRVDEQYVEVNPVILSRIAFAFFFFSKLLVVCESEIIAAPWIWGSRADNHAAVLNAATVHFPRFKRAAERYASPASSLFAEVFINL